MSTNKIDILEVNEYCGISANDKDTNKVYVVCFTPVPYTPPKDVKSGINWLETGDLVCNAIQTPPGHPK